MILFAAHIILALLLFRMVNLIGEYATDFGYSSTTLFEEPRESLALNFFIRSLAPSVFMIVLSAVAVASGHADLRFGIYWVAVYYYVFRAIYIFAMNMQNLVNWSRFLVHSGVGLIGAWLTYQFLVLPNRSLLPDLDTMGNELWLAIFAFLYTVANKLTVSGEPSDRRRNAYIKRGYEQAKSSFGTIIDESILDNKLKLIVYAVLIYEGYCRPPLIRSFERIFLFKRTRTTGIMQVNSETALSDIESVVRGTKILREAWERSEEETSYGRAREAIREYNRDENYIQNVFDVMEILAKRSDPLFESAYKQISSYRY